MTAIEHQAQIRDFAAVLLELDKGRTHTDLSNGLRELVKAVQDTGKKGTISLSILVKPIKPGQTDTLDVTATVKVDAPQPTAPSTIFFTTQEGDLTREDPSHVQMAFDIRTDEKKEPTIR